MPVSGGFPYFLSAFSTFGVSVARVEVSMVVGAGMSEALSTFCWFKESSDLEPESLQEIAKTAAANTSARNFFICYCFRKKTNLGEGGIPNP